MHVRSVWWGRRVAAVVLLACLAAGIGLCSSPHASAHSGLSIISIALVRDSDAVRITATATYPDGDVVEHEDVVGVAYAPASGRVRSLRLVPTAAPGEYAVRVALEPGAWQVEVDAVTRTRGLQSVGFMVTSEGDVAEVVSPSPLPATVQVDTGPAIVAALAPQPSDRKGLLLGTALCVAVMVLLVALVRRRRLSASPRPPVSRSSEGR